MPTYINSGTSTVYVDDPPLKLNAGATVALPYYLKTLPTGVTKTLDTPLAQPWDLLATVSSAPSSSIDVYTWENIVICNVSNGVVTVSVNGDDTNAMAITASSKEVWSNADGLFGSIKILTSAGSGDILVWGSR
jgi:hypothetical protein